MLDTPLSQSHIDTNSDNGRDYDQQENTIGAANKSNRARSPSKPLKRNDQRSQPKQSDTPRRTKVNGKAHGQQNKILIW